MKKADMSYAVIGILIALAVLLFTTPLFGKIFAGKDLFFLHLGIKERCEETGKTVDHYEGRISELESKHEKNPDVVFLDSKELSMICKEYKSCFPEKFNERPFCKECEDKEAYLDFIRSYRDAGIVVALYEKVIECYPESKEELKQAYLSKYKKEASSEKKQVYKEFLQDRYPEIEYGDEYKIEDGELYSLKEREWLNMEDKILSDEQIRHREKRDEIFNKKSNLKIDTGEKLYLNSEKGLYFSDNLNSYIYHFYGGQFVVSKFVDGKYGNLAVNWPSTTDFQKALNSAGLILDNSDPNDINYILTDINQGLFNVKKYGLDDLNNFYEYDGNKWNNFPDNGASRYLYVPESEFRKMEEFSKKLKKIKAELVENE
ncbi:hypothetical protein GF323_01255 [Candidatus Woesearchaeota archaeon]|nr:hypothetical protein [Candidatus Woesearchaeota archaeon]